MSFLHVSFDCPNKPALNFKMLKRFSCQETVGDLVSCVIDENGAELKLFKVKGLSSAESMMSPGTIIESGTPCTTLYDFGQKFIRVELKCQEEEPGLANEKKTTSAFDIPLNAQKKYCCLPDYRNPNNAKDKLYNRFIDVLQENGIAFTSIQKENIGVTVVRTMTNALWYISPHMEKFQKRAITIPAIFIEFKGYNDWKQKKLKEPQCKADELKVHIEAVADMLMIPWFGISQNAQLQSNCIKLNEALQKYHTFLTKQQERDRVHHTATEPIRSLSDHWTLIAVNINAKENPKYKEVAEILSKMDTYQPFWLFHHEPEDRFDRRVWYGQMTFPFPAKLYTHRVGNYMGNYSFVWRLPEDVSDRDDVHDIGVLSEIRENLPTFSTRAMRKIFIDRYAKMGIKAAVLRNMYQYLTGDSSTSETRSQSEVDERFAKFILQSDDPDLIYDLRANNGRPDDQRLKPFWDSLNKYIESESIVHERRHGEQTYLPIAISLEDLREEVLKTLPVGTPSPSISWLFMNFWPSNPYGKSAINHTGRFQMKFAVQQRIVRASHPDKDYAFYLFTMMKMMSVKFRDLSSFICVDDKAIVPIGEPGKPVSTTTRTHNHSLVPANAKLCALDHDFHVHGIVPSVLFQLEIPESHLDSFYDGTIHVTLKDKVFEPSSATRHTTEITSILRSTNSADGVSLSTPILFVYSDGGPDHRSTYWSVQLAYIELFISLDLDFLVTARTAPSHSYHNPAERCMSLLNLALQNVSLQRNSMSDDEEFRVKSKSTMKSRRDIAEKQPALRDAMIHSVEPVISKLKQRFARLKYKEEHIQVHDAASTDAIKEIQSVLDIFRNAGATKSLTVDDLQDRNCIRKYPKLEQFIERHCRLRHYSFQIKKCAEEECFYCVFNPKRSLEDVNWLPDPVYESSGTGSSNFKEFESLYGTETNDQQRPSLKDSGHLTDKDKQHKGIMTAAAARSFIVCFECGKRRVIYSKAKLGRVELMAIEVLQDNLSYSCGSPLFPDGQYCDKIVCKEGQNCSSPMEISYYSAKTVSFQDVCFYCGDQDIYDGEKIAEFKQNYSIVRPICSGCVSRGVHPAVRNALKVGQKRKH